MAEEWSHSEDGEEFEGKFSTREEAIAEGIATYELRVGDVIYVARVVPLSASDFVSPGDADSLIDDMGEASFERVGELRAAEGWPDVTIEQTADLQVRLQAVVDKWATDHDLQPKFWAVEESEGITVTAEMVADAT